MTVWFSEKDVPLGAPLLREIDKGIADKELSALLARDLLVPIVHNTTFEDLREVSPLLGSRSGLSTIEKSMEEVLLETILHSVYTPQVSAPTISFLYGFAGARPAFKSDHQQ